MVTVEAAIAIGSIVAVLALVLAAMGGTLTLIRCADAAAEAARLASRGDSGSARRAAGRLAPGGATITVELRGDDVVARVDAAPLGSALSGVRIGAQSTAVREPDEVASGEPGPDVSSDQVAPPPGGS